MRVLGALLLAYTSIVTAVAAEPVAQPSVAIIIDDMGYDGVLGRQALALPGAVTYAFLPGTPHAEVLAAQAYDLGREAIVHMPMEAKSGAALGPGGLTSTMTPEQLRQTVLFGLAAVPNAVGVNNHMGSRLTSDPKAMAQVMATLRERGGYYFVDSRTNDKTVALSTAQAHGLPSARRDVFLDNERDEAYITGQLQRLIALARERGSAIAIAHPYPETLAVLHRELPKLSRHGLGLLPVSRIIDRQSRSPQWPASSFPSQLAAKNSKQ